MEVFRTNLFLLLIVCASSGYGAEVRLANGDRYIGDVADGVLSGKGTYIWSGGDRYTGSFANDQPDGLGTYNSVSYTHLTLPTKA